MAQNFDIISLDQAANLSDLFHVRVHRTPDKVAYRYYDNSSNQWTDISWSQMADHVARWQEALRIENLAAGDRVALMINNCPEWVMLEQAAIGLGLVVVPLYTNDRADNVSYIIDNADIKVLLIQGQEHWDDLKSTLKDNKSLQRIVSIDSLSDSSAPILVDSAAWLPDPVKRYPLATLKVHKSSLATIVYTSGTTGKPKGVMLSHGNILWNANSGTDSVDVYDDDQFLSFLPLSHMFERTVGYYLPMMCGCTVNYARSIEKLAEDLITIKPTVLITVPRIFERVYNKIMAQLAEKSPVARFLFNSTVNVGWYRFNHEQKRCGWHFKLLFWPLLYSLVGRKVMNKLGGNLRVAISGGAPLAIDVARTFIGLGLNISQGYGLTETSPVICTNKLDDNDPASVGAALRDVEVKLGNKGELVVRSPGVMIGYWNNEQATKDMIDADGWLYTGDIAKIENDHIYITGRIKEILVLSNGEKVPPADIEMAICNDPLFEQVLVVGEQKPYLSAITILNPDEWYRLAISLGLDASEMNMNKPEVHEAIKNRISALIADFPGFAKINAVYAALDPWTVTNTMLTPTLKLRRKPIMEKYASQVEAMYKGH